MKLLRISQTVASISASAEWIIGWRAGQWTRVTLGGNVSPVTLANKLLHYCSLFCQGRVTGANVSP
jgi:hypothetical protein